MLQNEELDRAASRIAQLLAREPDAAWPRLALGELYYRRLWRRDCLKQWELALDRDAALSADPTITTNICHMLDAKWQSSGVTRFLTRLGERAAPLLAACVSSAENGQLRAEATRALHRLQPSGRPHRR